MHAIRGVRPSAAFRTIMRHVCQCFRVHRCCV